MALSWSLHRSRPDETDAEPTAGPTWPATSPADSGAGTGPAPAGQPSPPPASGAPGAGRRDGAFGPSEAEEPGPERPPVSPAGLVGPAGPVDEAGLVGPAGLVGQDGLSDEAGAEVTGRAGRLPATGTSMFPVLSWLRQSTFRNRVSILVAVAVGISVTLAAVFTYVAARTELDNQVNNNLSTAVTNAPPAQPTFDGTLDQRPYIDFELQTGDQVQLIGVDPQGNEVIESVQRSTGQMVNARFFAVTSPAQAVFQDGSSANPVVQTEQGTDHRLYRVATFSQGKNLVMQIGYPLADTNHTLAFLRLVLFLVVLGGIGLALALGWAVGKATMKPVENLTLAAEHVAETQDLTATIDEEGNDELARLGRSFNAMLAALSSSRLQQAHLISDAGHELRTPLTSLRTNIEVLMRNRNLADEDRDALLADVEAQLQELTSLVGDLVDLAREDEKGSNQPDLVALDELVQRTVERAKRRAMSVNFEVALQPGTVQAQPALLERAVMNVLDNAAKWSPAGGTVSVNLVADDTWHLWISDQGPGIAPEDMPHVFERFYRAATARSLPGSGLGLAIVQRVVRSHGGTVSVQSRPGGGTTVEVTLPLPAPESLPSAGAENPADHSARPSPDA